MIEVKAIFEAVKDIGLVPVIVILLLLFQFRTIKRLERQNDVLLDKVLKLSGGNKNEPKINN